MSSRFSRLCFLGLIPLIKAYKVFETTCSAPSPDSEFMFVSAPNTRGTMSILWSSLFTIFACTWTLQHPNVPKQHDGRPRGKLDNLIRMLKKFYGDAMKMIVTVLAPEFTIGKACEDYAKASWIKERLSEYASRNGVTWTLTHSYYVVMGGFVIRGNPDPLSITNMRQIRRPEVFDALLRIEIDELKDKSKNDMFGKIIAVGQILWTLVQIVARAVQRLPVSPLEIAVAAFAICAVIINGLYWDKPQRVSTPITILDETGIEGDLIRTADEVDSEEEEAEDEKTEDKYDTPLGFGIHVWGIVDEHFDWSKRAMCAAGIGAIVFGGVHVIAWHFAFPTTIELICWRCASVYSAAFPLTWVLIAGTGATINAYEVSNKVKRILAVVASTTFDCIYVVARLFILVEIVRTLFFFLPGLLFLRGHRIFLMLVSYSWMGFYMACRGWTSRVTPVIVPGLCMSNDM